MGIWMGGFSSGIICRIDTDRFGWKQDCRIKDMNTLFMKRSSPDDRWTLFLLYKKLLRIYEFCSFFAMEYFGIHESCYAFLQKIKIEKTLQNKSSI